MCYCKLNLSFKIFSVNQNCFYQILDCIFRMSVTKTDDLETNRRILAYLTEHEPAAYGHTAFSLKNTPYSYEEFRYFVTVTCAEEIPALYRRAKERTGRDRAADQSAVSSAGDALLRHIQYVHDRITLTAQRGVFQQMDIQKCNLISPEDEMKPFPEYLPYFVRVYLTDADDAVILGMNRENGVYWLSVTNIKEAETIRAVFDHVSALRPTGCTGLTAVLARTRYTAKQLQMSSHLTPQSADDIFSYYQRIEGSIYGQEKGGKYYEIQKYNLLEPKKPNYMPDPEDRLIQAYYGPDNDLILVGSADNNYIYWLSLTKADDTETNRQIVEWLTYCVPSDFGAAYLALRKTPYSYDQMMSFYCAEITCFADISRALEKGTARRRCGTDPEAPQSDQDALPFLQQPGSDQGV